METPGGFVARGRARADAPGPSLAGFRPLAAAWLLLGSVEWIVGVALTVELYDTTGSTGWVAAGAVLRFLPLFLLGPLSGVVADRIDRRRVLAVSSAGRVGVLAGLALAVVADAPPALLVALAVADATLATPLRPAAVALVPDLVPETRLARANATLAAATQATWLLGPGLAAVGLRVGGTTTAVGVAAAVTALGVWAVVAVPRRPGRVATHHAPPPPLRMLLDGVVAVRTTPALLAVLVLAVAVYVAFGVELVAHVAVAEERLGIGADGVAVMTAAIGVGGLLGVPLAARLAGGAAAGRWLAAGSAVITLPVALIALPSSLGPALPLLVVEGAGNMLYDVLVITTLQRMVPGRMLARATALVETAQAGAQVAGSLVAPALIATAGLGPALVLTGTLTTAVALVTWPALGRADRALAARRTALAGEVALLSRLPLFEGASVAAVERAAAACRTVEVPHGAAVVREGEPAEAVFVIVDGELDVLVGGRDGPTVINRLTAGEAFGEIGVLRARPRTATVVADGPVTLWEIDADTLLEAVSLTAGVDRRIESMLARSDAAAAG